MKTRACVAGCVLAVLGVAGASGQVSLVTDVRSVSAQAFAQANGVSDGEGPISRSPSGFGAPWDIDNSASAIGNVIGAGMGVSAIQVSSITPAQILGQGSVSLSSTVSGSAVNPSTSGAGRSSCDLVFDVPLGASLELIASQSGVGNIVLSVDGGAVLASGSGVFNLTAPATRLRMSASAIATLSAPPNGSAGGGYSFILNVVPTPGALAALTLGVLIPARRRR